MTELAVIVPSRGRPEAAHQLQLEFIATCTASTALVLVVDDNDPTRDLYPTGTLVAPSRTMVQALNWAAERVASTAFAVGFMGDDHRPITRGWDESYLRNLREMGTGLVYGNDLLQGRRLPTQLAMTSDIVRTLGHMAPPEFGHLFIDNVWKAWGEGADCLRYLDEVIVEHRHPIALKAEWDAGHRRVNSERQQRADRQVWVGYQAARLEQAVASIRGLAA